MEQEKIISMFPDSARKVRKGPGEPEFIPGPTRRQYSLLLLSCLAVAVIGTLVVIGLYTVLMHILS